MVEDGLPTAVGSRWWPGVKRAQHQGGRGQDDDRRRCEQNSSRTKGVMNDRMVEGFITSEAAKVC